MNSAPFLPLVSVVVPVYNVEKYLRECVDSILSQTYDNIEVILVDDGSLDSSGEICDELSKREKRVKVIHQANGGVTAARCAGVKNAANQRGYITFVDADDTCPPDAIRTLIESTEDGTYDIVMGSLDRTAYRYPNHIFSPEAYRIAMTTGNAVTVGPFGKVFRKGLFSEKTFDIPREIRRGEDKLMNLRLAFSNTKPVRQIETVVYNYRQNTGSVMHTFLSTPEHKQLFVHHFSLSFPNEQRELYMPYFIESRLGTLREIAVDYPNTLQCDSEFRKQLKSDVKRMHYSLLFVDKIFLYSHSAIVIKTACFIQRVLRKLGINV